MHKYYTHPSTLHPATNIYGSQSCHTCNTGCLCQQHDLAGCKPPHPAPEKKAEKCCHYSRKGAERLGISFTLHFLWVDNKFFPLTDTSPLVFIFHFLSVIYVTSSWCCYNSFFVSQSAFLCSRSLCLFLSHLLFIPLFLNPPLLSLSHSVSLCLCHALIFSLLLPLILSFSPSLLPLSLCLLLLVSFSILLLEILFTQLSQSVNTLTMAPQHYLVFYFQEWRVTGCTSVLKLLWMYGEAQGCTHLLCMHSNVHIWCREGYQDQDTDWDLNWNTCSFPGDWRLLEFPGGLVRLVKLPPALSLASAQGMITERPGGLCCCTPWRERHRVILLLCKNPGHELSPNKSDWKQIRQLEHGLFVYFSCLEFSSNEAKFTNLLALSCFVCLFFIFQIAFEKNSNNACLSRNNSKNYKQKISPVIPTFIIIIGKHFESYPSCIFFYESGIL